MTAEDAKQEPSVAAAGACMCANISCIAQLIDLQYVSNHGPSATPGAVKGDACA